MKPNATEIDYTWGKTDQFSSTQKCKNTVSFIGTLFGFKAIQMMQEPPKCGTETDLEFRREKPWLYQNFHLPLGTKHTSQNYSMNFEQRILPKREGPRNTTGWCGKPVWMLFARAVPKYEVVVHFPTTAVTVFKQSYRILTLSEFGDWGSNGSDFILLSLKILDGSHSAERCTLS